MSKPIITEDIDKGLRSLGLKKGDVIEVHSSLSSFGFVEGGAETIIDVLMNIVGSDGTIVMSAYPVSKPLLLSEKERDLGILWKVEVFDETYDGPTGMGIIADKFRHRPGTKIGNGIHRVCAWGKNSELHIKGYDYLVNVNGLVLLLGVGIDRCSSMHQAEGARLPSKLMDYYQIPETIRKEYPNNINLGYGQTPENGWEKVWNIADQKGLIRKVMIGKANCKLFKAKDVIGIYQDALINDPLGLFGIGKK
jgi:aminoglycoside N3'-acetyltransferase